MNFVNHYFAPEYHPNYTRIARERNMAWEAKVKEYISDLEYSYNISISFPSMMKVNWTPGMVKLEAEEDVEFGIEAYERFDEFQWAIRFIEKAMEFGYFEEGFAEDDGCGGYLGHAFETIRVFTPSLANEMMMLYFVDSAMPLYEKMEEEKIMAPRPKNGNHYHDRYTCMKREKAKLHVYHEKTGRYSPSSYSRNGYKKEYMNECYKHGNRKTRKTFDLPSGKSGWKKLGSSAYF